jgi:cobalt transporter subunit CbtB
MSNTEVVMLATNTHSTPLALGQSARISTAIFAGALGFFFLYVAAFANADVLHNAAHDTRHAIVAPCH